MMQVADGGGAHAEADLGAFGNGLLAAAVGRAGGALGLIEQVRELGPRALEARGVDVGDVVGDHLDVGLLGVHSRRGDGE